MKVSISKTELYPVYILYLETNSIERVVDVPESIIKEYSEIFVEFYKIQDKIESLYNGAKNE